MLSCALADACCPPKALTAFFTWNGDGHKWLGQSAACALHPDFQTFSYKVTSNATFAKMVSSSCKGKGDGVVMLSRDSSRTCVVLASQWDCSCSAGYSATTTSDLTAILEKATTKSRSRFATACQALLKHPLHQNNIPASAWPKNTPQRSASASYQPATIRSDSRFAIRDDAHPLRAVSIRNCSLSRSLIILCDHSFCTRVHV